jgi:hypothetical protein
MEMWPPIQVAIALIPPPAEATTKDNDKKLLLGNLLHTESMMPMMMFQFRVIFR